MAERATDPAADIRHLAETIVAADQVEQTPVLGHAHAAFDDDIESVAHLVFAHQYGLRRLFLPFADAQDFPQFDIGEVLEQRHLAQCGELLRLVDLEDFLLETPQRGEVAAEILPVLVALALVLVHGAQHDALQLRRDIGAQAAQSRRGAVQNQLAQGRQIVRLERRITGKQAIHHDAQGINIGLVRQHFAAQLFRRHVTGRADVADLGLFDVQQQRRAHVRDLDVSVRGEQHVGGFDVAVDHAVELRIVQRTAALEHVLHHAVDGQQIARFGVFFQRAAVDVFHDDVAGVVAYHRVVDRHDVRVRQLARERSFIVQLALVQLAHFGVAQYLLLQYLDRDFAF